MSAWMVWFILLDHTTDLSNVYDCYIAFTWSSER